MRSTDSHWPLATAKSRSSGLLLAMPSLRARAAWRSPFRTCAGPLVEALADFAGGPSVLQCLVNLQRPRAHLANAAVDVRQAGASGRVPLENLPSRFQMRRAADQIETPGEAHHSAPEPRVRGGG